MRLSIWFSCLFCAIAFAVSPASAQNVPSSIDPGNVGRRVEDFKKPDVTAEPLVTDEATPQERGGTGKDVQFVLKSVKISGGGEYEKVDFAAIYGEYIGQKVSLARLHGLADKITAKLRNEGYVLSRAIVPGQRVNDGNVVIRIVGGEVSNVIVEGDIKGSESLVQAYADKIRAQHPLNFKKLERYLLLMEDLPGVTAKGYLRPGKTAGTSDLVIQLTHDYVEGRVGIDNRGNKFLGSNQGNALLKLNSVFGLYEQTSIRTNITADTDELRYFELLHEEQIGHEGTKLTLSASHADTAPGSTLKPLHIEGESTEYSATVSHPFLRSRSENLIAEASFVYRDAKSKAPLFAGYEDNIRLIHADLGYDFVDGWQGINRVEGGISHGLNILGSDNAITSRANTDETFTKFTGTASHLQSLYGPLSLQLTAAGQYSNDSLYSSEEFGLGGVAFGSAYDAFEISGDKGVAARGELQLNDPEAVRLLSSYQLYGFYDAGKVWNNKTVVGDSKDDSLTSAGFGVRFNLEQPVSGGLEVAFPISRDVQSEGDKDPRLFFNLTYHF